MTKVQQIRRHGITVEYATVWCSTKRVRRTVAYCPVSVPGSRTVGFYGFSFGASKTARERSLYEVYERLFSYRPFRKVFFDRVRPDCFALHSHAKSDRIPDRFLFLDGKDHGAGSGSAAHTTLTAALHHGVNEIVERDILCRLWYERAFGLQAVTRPKKLTDDLCISSWTIAGGKIPFCLSVVTDKDETVFVTGSKTSTSLNKARIGAEREAFLLYDSLPAESDPRSSWRVKSLRGPLAAERIRHFNQLIEPGHVSRDCLGMPHSASDVVQRLGKSMRHARYALLADLPKLKVVQVYCPGWLTKAESRRKFQRSATPADAFC